MFLFIELTTRALNNLFKTKLSSNLTYVDISAYTYHLGYDVLDVIAKYCPNLTHLDISKLKISNNRICELFKKCNKLNKLVAAHCIEMSDKT